MHSLRTNDTNFNSLRVYQNRDFFKKSGQHRTLSSLLLRLTMCWYSRFQGCQSSLVPPPLSSVHWSVVWLRSDHRLPQVHPFPQVSAQLHTMQPLYLHLLSILLCFSKPWYLESLYLALPSRPAVLIPGDSKVMIRWGRRVASLWFLNQHETRLAIIKQYSYLYLASTILFSSPLYQFSLRLEIFLFFLNLRNSPPSLCFTDQPRHHRHSHHSVSRIYRIHHGRSVNIRSRRVRMEILPLRHHHRQWWVMMISSSSLVCRILIYLKIRVNSLMMSWVS